MRKLIQIVMMTISVCACEPIEVEIKDVFDFQIESKSKDIEIVQKEIPIEVSIKPERLVSGTNYTFSFDNIEGKGSFKLNGEELTPNQDYPLNQLLLKLTYTGYEAGQHQLKTIFKDDNGQVREHILKYTIVDKTDFIFNVSAENSNVYFTEEINLNFEITPIESSVMQELTFDMSFDSFGLNGKLIYNGNEYYSNEIISNVPAGKFKAVFVGQQTGKSDLIFTAMASNDLKKDNDIKVEIKETDFDLEVLFDKAEDYVNDKTGFNIIIDKKGVENLTYETYFTNIEGEIQLPPDNQTIHQNTLFDIPPGTTRGSFISRKIGSVEIEFVVKASNGVTKSKKVNYNTLPTNFDVIIDPIPLRAFYKFNVAFEIKIIPPEVDDYTLEYDLRYSTDIGKATSLELIDLENPNGSMDEYNFGTRTWTRARLSLLGLIEPASGNITFVFIDSNGVEAVKTVPLEFYDH
jgi:hypothetical protein